MIVGGFTNQNVGSCCCESSSFYFTELHDHKVNWGQVAPEYWIYAFEKVRTNNNIIIPLTRGGMWYGFKVLQRGLYRLVLSDMAFTLKGLKEAWLQIFINNELYESTPTAMNSQQFINSILELEVDSEVYVRIWTMEDTLRKNIQAYPYDTSTIPNATLYNYPKEGKVGGILRLEKL